MAIRINPLRLKNVGFTEKEHGDDNKSTTGTRTYEIQTSLTTDYRKTRWGVERIVLDAISNHLPEDSKGTKTTIRIKQKGQWYDLKTANLKDEAEEVVFEDDGKGYDSGLLGLLYSTKAADTLSVGQFGEGLKMISAAALREGNDIEFESKNWTAVPFARDETVGSNALKRLCFRVTENGHHLQGSRTVFKNPSKALLEQVFAVPENVLAFNDTYRELPQNPLLDLYMEDVEKDMKELLIESMSHVKKIPLPPNILQRSNYRSRIIDLQNGKTGFFVKGVKIQDIQSIFSYDLGLEEITPDRIFADREKMLSGIELLLKGSKNPEVIDEVLRRAHETPMACLIEFEALRNRLMDRSWRDDRLMTNILEKYLDKPKTKKSHWKEAFERVYGKDAVLASLDTNVNADAKLMGFKPVELNCDVREYLKVCGVQSANDIKNEKQYKWVDDRELTDEERKIISLSGEIDAFLGDKKPVPVRVYSGIFMQTGREITSNPAVYVTKKDGTRYIGVRRDVLKDPMQFVQNYIHERGHDITKADDYDRGFAGFFIERLA